MGDEEDRSDGGAVQTLRSLPTSTADQSPTQPQPTLRSQVRTSLILETIQTDFHAAVLQAPLQWEDGYMLAPTASGLGIELNEEVIAAHPYTTGGRLHLEMTQTPLSSDNTFLVTDVD